jgi:two-component system NarL family sensor kinase
VKIELDLEGRAEAGALVGRALAQVRDLSNLLRPSVLDDLGLAAAMNALVDDFAKRTRIDTRLSLEGPRRLPADVEVVLYRVVQEALTNIAKHAHATQALVRLRLDDRRARLTVEDNGRGVSVHETPDGDSHLGWLGMRERLTAVNGTLSMAVATNGGLRIDADIPLEAR